MCMEDIRIGRESAASESLVSVAATETPLVSPAEDRIGLAIYPVATNTIFLSTVGGVVPNNGIRVNDATGPLIMNFLTHGSLVRKGWNAAIPAGAGAVSVTEVFLARS